MCSFTSFYTCVVVQGSDIHAYVHRYPCVSMHTYICTLLSCKIFRFSGMCLCTWGVYSCKPDPAIIFSIRSSSHWTEVTISYVPSYIYNIGICICLAPCMYFFFFLSAYLTLACAQLFSAHFHFHFTWGCACIHMLIIYMYTSPCEATPKDNCSNYLGICIKYVLPMLLCA